MSVATLKRINRSIRNVRTKVDWTLRPNLKKQQFDAQLRDLGFVVTKKQEVAISDTVIINLPKCALSEKYRGDTSQFEFFNKMVTNDKGVIDCNITRSMHVKFLRDHFEKSLPYEATEYWTLRKEYTRLGVSSWSDEQLRARMDDFVQLCVSIKTQGFKNKLYANNPFVLERPYMQTRHNVDYDSGGYEIWLGHHRLAALAYLGYEKIDVYLMRDIRPWENSS